MQKSVVFLLCICLMTAACSTTLVKPEYRYLHPSQGLLLPCDKPHLVRSETAKHLVQNSNARQLAFENCNERHEALIRWHEEMRRKEATTTDGEKPQSDSSQKTRGAKT